MRTGANSSFSLDLQLLRNCKLSRNTTDGMMDMLYLSCGTEWQWGLHPSWDPSLLAGRVQW